MDQVDPFAVFRTTLFIALTTYLVLTTSATMWRVASLLRGSDPQRRFLRLYLSYQLVTVRFKPLADELFQIGCWLAALTGLWWLHGRIG